MRAIVSFCKNGFIADGAGDIPWLRSPEALYDMQNFIRVTKAAGAIAMGSTTAATFPAPLSHRRNFVLTRRLSYARPGFIPVNSVSDIPRNAIIIGGEQIYNLFLPKLKEIIVTTFEDYSIENGVGFSFYEKLNILIKTQSFRQTHAHGTKRSEIITYTKDIK